MTITHDTCNNMFLALDDDGNKIGEIEYSPGTKTIVAVHTWTDDCHRGKGIAGKLLDAMVAFAAENDLKIHPVCSYVVHIFTMYPEKYAHVRSSAH